MIATFFCALLCAGDALTAAQIFEKARAQGGSLGVSDANVELTLRITTPSKEVRVRQLQMKTKRADGLNKAFVRFLSPPDVAGTAFLSIENRGRDDDQFLYLPALGKSKRIGASQRGQSFVGTDFSYGDLDARYLNENGGTRLADESVQGQLCFVLQTPLGEGDYARAKVWVAQSDDLVRKVEFYDKTGALWKVLTVAQVKTVGARTIISDSTMEDKKRGSQTEVIIGKVDLDAKVPDADFTEKALSRG